MTQIPHSDTACSGIRFYIVECFIVFLIFLVLRHDSCNDSLSIPHRVLTLANCLNWIFKVFTLPQKLCKPALLLMQILVGYPKRKVQH